jgi:hypothetical protein
MKTARKLGKGGKPAAMTLADLKISAMATVDARMCVPACGCSMPPLAVLGVHDGLNALADDLGVFLVEIGDLGVVPKRIVVPTGKILDHPPCDVFDLLGCHVVTSPRSVVGRVGFIPKQNSAWGVVPVFLIKTARATPETTVEPSIVR